MSDSELGQLELLAEVDTLAADLDKWAASASAWPPARHCRALVARVAERMKLLRVRMEAPLVVATLGGTGTGKSTLVNALVGAEVVPAGRERPTTRRPYWIARPDVSPDRLGVDPSAVEFIPSTLSSVADLVLVDCPDPDTTEGDGESQTNLGRLREILPHCDVLLVTATQQKYRSARVSDELRRAAVGARMVFVLTHADTDEDVREDWRKALSGDYAAGDMFWVDSRAALEDAADGVAPRGEFGRLVDLLTRELTGAAAHRIRRANFVDVVQHALESCRLRLDADLPKVNRVETQVEEQRRLLASRLAETVRRDLNANRRPWEHRLIGEIAGRWGFSPFSCVLRLWHGLGGWVTGAALLRARTPAQMALWGAVEAGRRITRRREERDADEAPTRAVAGGWDDEALRKASLVLAGYASEAGLSQKEAEFARVKGQAQRAGSGFVLDAAGRLQEVVGRLAARNTGSWTRAVYETLTVAMLALLVFRLGKNYFYDSWLAPAMGWATAPADVFRFDFVLVSGLWFAAWCAVLLWAFTARLRRGLGAEIETAAQEWGRPDVAADLFAGLEAECRFIRAFRAELLRLEQTLAGIKSRLDAPEGGLSRRH